jgi:esterase/lipase superfamily enzyme
LKRTNQVTEQFFQLKYFWESRIGERPLRSKKNLQMSSRCSPDLDFSVFLNGGNLPWRLGHQLEGRDPDSSTDGIWSISQWRCEKRFGNIGNHIVPFEQGIADVSTQVSELMRRTRLFGYFRIPYSEAVVQFLRNNKEVRFSMEITADWYDPPEGILPRVDASPEFLSSHAVPLIACADGNMVFQNSWGAEWGHNGFGMFPVQNWDSTIIDAWFMTSDGLFVPPLSTTGILLRGWKWEPVKDFAIHGREVYDAETDEYLAWAFCVVRDGYLDVDEFFVWPSERGKGYGRQLANMALQLSREMRLPIRQIVSFADTESSQLSGALAVARMLNIRLVESDVRWASMIGTANAVYRPSRNWRPIRPASILEKLRPKAEPPLREPQQYTVFFGTNRSPVNPLKVDDGFSNQRGSQLYVGHCLVEIAVTHTFGTKGRWFRSLWKSANSEVTSVKMIQCLNHDEFKQFAAHFQRKCGDSAQNLLFVHGYQNSFEDAVLRAAQLGVDLKVPGSTFVFSWPSAASAVQYSADEATIDSSIDYLEQFVMMILSDFPDVPLNIVAHSMGNRAVVRLLERLTVQTNLPGRLGQVVFAAPDVDADLFRQSTPKFKNLPKRMSAYVSRADFAVQTSKLLHGYDRVGLAPPVTIADGVETVLVEGFNVFEFLCHDYIASAGPVLHDLFNLIHYDSPPDNRPRIRPVEQEDGKTYWLLPMN